MIEARLIVEEFDEEEFGTGQEDRGILAFEAFPHAGDIIRVGRDGRSRDLEVSRLLHLPAEAGQGSEPSVYVIAG